MTNETQIPSEFVSLFSNQNFLETMKVISLYLAKEDKKFREELTAVLVPDIEELIQTRIAESYTSPEFTEALESGLSTLDIFCNIPRRILDLEYAVGIRECDPEEIEDHAVPERILNIEAKINNGVVGTSKSSPIEIKQKTKTGRRAMALIKALMDSKKGHLTRTKIREVLSDEKNEELGDARITENTSNPRSVIIDAINEAKKLCSRVEPNQKSYGRHEWRLLLRS